MSQYLQSVLKAAGGHAAPAENLKEESVRSGGYEIKEPIEKYFPKKPKLIQDLLKSAISEAEDEYSEEYLEIYDLTPTQDTVDPSNFKEAADYEKPVVVYRDDSGAYLVDGHHRCATKVKNGSSGIKAKVYKKLSLTSSADSEANTKKDSDDPCWSGYVQVGMKKKNGKRVPNCVPSAATINMLVDDFNSQFGSARHITKEAAYSVARSAFERYSDLSDEEIYSAILWELHAFAEYATSGSVEDVSDDFSEYAGLTAEGHPGRESSIVAAAAWISGAPELSESSRDAIANAFNDELDQIESLHATSRVRALLSSGELSESTLAQIKALPEKYPKVS